jgi:hypothetical protein
VACAALTEFVRERTRPEEIGHLASGRGLYLPPDVSAEVTELCSARDPDEATAAVLALLCGTLVERGASPEAAIEAGVGLLL